MAQIDSQTANPAQPQGAPDTIDAAPDTIDAAAAPDTLDAAAPPDPNKVLASTKYAGAPSTEQPGFVQRTMENSGAAGIGNLIGQTGGYVGTMPGRTFNRVKGIQAAYEALKQGDLKKASMIAHTLATGPDDPVTEMAKNIIKMPFEEAAEAYKSLRDNPDKVSAVLEAAQHGIRSIPVIGAGAEQVGNNIAEDFHNNNWTGLSGDIVGILPALLFGGENRAAAAAETSGAEGAAEAAMEAKKNAIRPSQRMIGKTPVPVTALQEADPTLRARMLKTVANDPAAAQSRFIAEHTQPAAATAAVTTLEDVARKHIQMVREELGNHAPFEGDMGTIGKQANAMRESASDIYQKFDKASDAEQEAYKTQTALDKEQFENAQVEKEKAFDEAQAAKKEDFEKTEQAKVKAGAGKATPYKAKPFKAEKFEGENFEPEERPLTFDELQHQRAQITKAMQRNAVPFSDGQDALQAVEQKMDDFAERHADVVSPEEYKLANETYKAATKHDFIADRLKIALGTDEIPTKISKGSLSSIQQAFDSNKKFGPGAFEQYLGPEGMKNFQSIRDVLENPVQSSPFLRLAKMLMGEAAGAGVGVLSGTGTEGAIAGMAAKYGIGHIAENLLFNPEYGQTMLAAWKRLHTLPNSQVGRLGVGAGQIAPVAPRPSEATHVWSPEQGVTPIQ
jgi:hypothetical protein